MRCTVCNRIIWPWQKRLAPFHKSCVKIFLDAYAKGMMAGCQFTLGQIRSAEQIPESAVIH